MNDRILIINDDRDVRKIIQLVLEKKGYKTTEAEDGRDGVYQAINEQPDLILLDVMMPYMDGYETCRILKRDAKTKDIPVLFLSSLNTPKDKIKGLEAGGVDFINSVADHGELLARVETHLQIRSLNQSLMKTNAELLRKQKTLEDDLNAAALIQKSFLPRADLEAKGFQIASLWLPTGTLGGDIFNFIPCNGKTIIYIADVSGHDVPSALCTVSVSQFVNQYKGMTGSVASPKEMLALLNAEFPLERFDRYLTLFYMIIDNVTGELSYSSAAHPPAIIIRKSGGLEYLDCGGTIIGLKEEQQFEEWSEKLMPGDKMFLYTDGVQEIKNREGNFFGSIRLFQLLEKIKQEPPQTIVETVKRALIEFAMEIPPRDDISIICFQFNGVN